LTNVVKKLSNPPYDLQRSIFKSTVEFLRLVAHQLFEGGVKDKVGERYELAKPYSRWGKNQLICG
jgi:hypothetical protein